MSVKKITKWSASFLLVSAVAVACSSDDPGEEGSGGSDTTTTGQGAAGQGGTGQGGATTTTTTSAEGGGSVGGGTPGGGCTSPIEIMVGDTVTGDTTGGADEHSSSCQEGSDAEDVYTITPASTGQVTITLTSDADLGLYLRTDCADGGTETACTDDAFDEGAVERLGVELEQGTTYYLFVDGFTTGEAGPYTLTVAQETVCNDMMDDDGNGLADCEDPNCMMDSTCASAITAACGGASALTPGSTQSGDTSGGTTLFAASCTGAGLASEQLYSYTATQNEILALTLNSATDQGLYARATCDDYLSQLQCFDVFPSNPPDEGIQVQLMANDTVTLFVDGYENGEAGPFTLSSVVVTPTESEPNDSYQTADAYASPWAGYIESGGDEDWVAITVGSSGATLTATTEDVHPGDCAASRVDTAIELFDTDGTSSLATNDDIDVNNGNYCSEVSATSLAAGTYYLRVASTSFCPTCATGYTLDVTIQ